MKIQKKNEYDMPFRMTIQAGREVLVIPHWHENFEFIKVLAGSTLITVEQSSFIAKEGDIIYIASNQVHSVKAIDIEKSSIMGMVIERDYVSSVIEKFETRQLIDIFIYSKIIDTHYTKEHSLWKDLDRCMSDMFREYQEREVLFEMAIRENMYRLIRLIVRYYESRISNDIYLRRSKEWVLLQPVFDYISKHYPYKIYIDDLCRLVAMSPSHFSRFFKKVTGKTPMAYVNQIRIEAAIKLLREGNYHIAKISDETGFSNMGYFSKIFKRSTGMTPLQYRESYTKIEY